MGVEKILDPEGPLCHISSFIDNLEALAFWEKLQIMGKHVVELGCESALFSQPCPCPFCPLLTDAKSPGTRSICDLCDWAQAASSEVKFDLAVYRHFTINNQMHSCYLNYR